MWESRPPEVRESSCRGFGGGGSFDIIHNQFLRKHHIACKTSDLAKQVGYIDGGKVCCKLFSAVDKMAF
jgi:hypothetical protein